MNKAITVTGLIFLGILGLGYVLNAGAEEGLIPSWIKNTAKFWTDGNVSDSEFINALQYLIDQGILIIPTDETEEKGNSSLSDYKKLIKPSAAVDANNQFTFKFYNQVASLDDENIFFSPLSIFTAFAVVYEGAKENTSMEIADVFGLQTNDSERRSSFEKIINNLTDTNSNYTVNFANALWLAQGFEPISSYVDTAKRYYESEINSVDFISDKGVNTINKWVSEKTENKIIKLLELGSTDANTRLIITNAIYFNGTWSHQFEDGRTRETNFKLNSGETILVPMMYLAPKVLNYLENEHLQMLELPYKGDNLSMLVLLPKESDGINSVTELLNANNFAKWKTNLSEKRMSVFLPKFTLETNYDLKSSLPNMGIKSAFDPQTADFGGISANDNLYIAFATHKAFVDVNEAGTEAAAVTGIGVSTTSAPPSFVVDHPFIIIIQNNENGNILFMGRIMNPS